MNGLMMHAGGRTIDMQELAGIWTPTKTETWQPVPHITVIEEVLQNIEANQMKLGKLEMGISKEGARFFAVAEIVNGPGDYSLVIGVRNSHDKKFPAGFCVGSRVLVCDNLAFSAEVVFARRHTPRILDQFPGFTTELHFDVWVFRFHVLSSSWMHPHNWRGNLEGRLVGLQSYPRR